MSYASADQLSAALRRIEVLEESYEAVLEQTQLLGQNHPTTEEAQAMIDEAMLIGMADLRGSSSRRW